jgi:hypothetical protein
VEVEIHSFLNSAFDAGDKPASRFSHFVPGKKASLFSIDNVCKSNDLPNVFRVDGLKLEVGIPTPWSGVLLEKLTGLQLVKKLPAFYGTRRFITAFTSAHHLSLS